MLVLTLNCGSSSAKFQIYDWQKKEVLLVGIVERIGQTNTRLEINTDDGKCSVRESACDNHDVALRWVMDSIQKSGISLEQIKAVGHRIVHGGESFIKSSVITDEVLEVFESLVRLAPLHMPPNISGVRAAQKSLPQALHCAVMDTAWHQTMTARAYMYPIPYYWYRDYKVRRYGFHGTSYLYTAKRAACLLGKEPQASNLIIAHIGNGASMCAVKDGVCVDTSMGFTPLEGLMMGTRSGSLDPAIIPFMMDRLGCSAKDIDNYLNKDSGILGLTEGLIDRRDVLKRSQQGCERAKLTLEMECYRVRKQIGSYAAVLGHIDALVFTAGVGEMSPEYRQLMAEELDILGLQLDRDKNALSHSRNCETVISTASSPAKIFVIPTDEELVMTADAVALLQGIYDVHTNFHYHFQEPSYRNPARERNLQRDLAKSPQLQEIIARPPRIPTI